MKMCLKKQLHICTESKTRLTWTICPNEIKIKVLLKIKFYKAFTQWISLTRLCVLVEQDYSFVIAFIFHHVYYYFCIFTLILMFFFSFYRFIETGSNFDLRWFVLLLSQHCRCSMLREQKCIESTKKKITLRLTEWKIKLIKYIESIKVDRMKDIFLKKRLKFRFTNSKKKNNARRDLKE